MGKLGDCNEWSEIKNVKTMHERLVIVVIFLCNTRATWASPKVVNIHGRNEVGLNLTVLRTKAKTLG